MTYSSSIINNFIITDNQAFSNSYDEGGAGIMVKGSNLILSYGEISNNTIICEDVFNDPPPGGGGIYVRESESTLLSNVTIVNNKSYFTNEGNIWHGGGVAVTDSNLDIINSIIMNNDDDLYIMDDSILSDINIIYSNIDDSTTMNSEIVSTINTITSDPLFLDAENYNYMLQDNSPCIDAGTSDINNDGLSDIFDYYGIAPDIGAYEWYPSFEIGDLNGDGIINVADVIAMVNGILSGSFTPEEFSTADMNANGIIDIVDIIALVNIILD